MTDTNDEVALEAAARGDEQAIGALLESYRPRLTRLVDLRLSPRLRDRLDAHDVVQEAFVEILGRLPKFLEDRSTSFFVWVRFLVLQKLQQFHRHHLGVAGRDPGREALQLNAPLGNSSLVLAGALFASGDTPSRLAMREERRETLVQALETMDEIDREVLLLRHFEHLSNKETAEVLELTEAGSSLRHVRALRRLKAVLHNLGIDWSG